MTTPWHRTAAAGLALLAAGCAGTGTANLMPGERPPASSDEGGLWMTMDRTEEALKTSGLVVTDAALTGYVRGVLCKLVPDHCQHIRLYVVETPGFNASMAPNGMMSVHTGALLRAQNEAQLAFVLGHEAAHYLRRHSLQLWRDVRAKTDGLIFFQIATAVVGLAPVGTVVSLVALETIFSFSRDNEREADRLGLEMVRGAGYDPRQAPLMWEALVEERNAGDPSHPFPFFSTHPTTEERLRTLKELAEASAGDGRDAVVGRDAYLAVLLPLRGKLLREELRRREFARTEVVLERLLAGAAAAGEVHFYWGELHRLRWEGDDKEKAVERYEQAIASGDAPVETHRSLGLVFARLGESERARQAFERYLLAAPGADDRAMVESYIEQLRGGTS